MKTTRLGARVLKRYARTGGDLALRWPCRREPERRWLDPGSLESLHRFERTTRLNEAVHLLGFAGFTSLALKRSGGSLSRAALSLGLGAQAAVRRLRDRRFGATTG